MNVNVLTVSQLNFYIKSILDSDANLENIFLTGEISNFTDHYQSGHFYFSLKDNKSVVKAIMFAGFARRVKFRPQNGMKVIVRGRVTVYEPSGVYQVYVEDMQPDGVGALNLAFEQLKEKLLKEGLFDTKIKKSLPKYPQKVGVITSETGAVFWDIQNVMKRRFPLAEIVFQPVLVQGEGAAEQIIGAIKEFNEDALCDVLIVARGGGSIEDLWAFNDENLARTIADSKIPIVSAVGHETDFTICDFVADLRAPTPSAAAELVVPDAQKLISDLEYLTSYVNSLMRCRLNDYRKILDSLLEREVLKSPKKLVSNRGLAVEALANALKLKFGEVISKNKEKFLLSVGKLDALSPLKLMSSGYCVAFDKENSVINCVEQVAENDRICVAVFDGKFDCIVKNVTSGGAFYGKR